MRALAAVARTGAARLAPWQLVLGDPDKTILGALERIFDQNLVAAVHLGPPRPNRKPVLHLMDRRGRTLAFVKVGVNELTDARVRAETTALRAVAARKPARMLVPRVRAAGTWQGHAYAVLEPVPTGRGPSAVPTEAAHRLADAFPVRRRPVVECGWWLETRDALHAAEGHAHSGRLRRAMDHVADAIPGDGVRLGATHGDFTPWNCFVGPDGVSVWDWERFATDRPLGWDALHYAVSLALRRGAGRTSALAAVRRSAADLVEANGGDRDSSAWTYAAYLLHRGASRLHVRRLVSGAPDAALDVWLLPELESLLTVELAGRR